MNGLWSKLRGEPVASMAIVTAAIGVATILGAPEKVMGAIAILIGAILAFPIRSGVAPVAAVVTATRAAAVEAATAVAEQVNSHTAGPIGAITEEAAAVAATAADDAADQALRNLGVKRNARAAT